jgi:alcohol dehydrogenase
MSRWSYYNPTEVVKGNDLIDEISDHVDFDRAVLITTNGFVKRGVAGRIEKSLGPRLVGLFDTVRPNPDLEMIDALSDSIRKADPDCLIALGGGSAIDTAKALARLISSTNGITLADHFRRGEPFVGSGPLPIIAIPTTAGTGAEVTPFGTIWDHRLNKKYSIEGTDLFPLLAILDPVLSVSLPVFETISTGLDAISHAFESIWNVNANPITLGFAESSLSISLKTLPLLIENQNDLVLRGRMMEAATLAGLSISHTHTSIAHSVSYPLTVRYGVPHGIACSFALPEFLRYNSQTEDDPLDLIAVRLGFENTEGLARHLEYLLKKFNVAQKIEARIPDLNDIAALTKEMINRDRVGNNRIPVNETDLEIILKNSIRRSLSR